MKRIFPLILILSVVVSTAQAQRVLRQQLVTSISAARMDSMRKKQHVPRRLAPVRYGVDVYEIEYSTTWWDGSPVMASGFYIVPQDCKQAIPMLAYNHGTRLHRARTFKVGGEEAICAFFAADGYAVVMPDYLGLGTGDRLPIYMHAETEATATVDRLVACSTTGNCFSRVIRKAGMRRWPPTATCKSTPSATCA